MSEFIGWNHYNPVRIECTSLDNLRKHVSGQHVLLVTTSGFTKRGVVQRIKDILPLCRVTVWDGVKANPDLEDLDVIARELKKQNLSSVIGLGGGSSLDAAKVLAVIIGSPCAQTLAEVFRDKVPMGWDARLPLVAIPTTSGTGAEVTPFATVWDHAQKKKYSLAGDFIYPDVALLDPHLTITLGEEDTLYPALDAISHALESLWNKNCTPVSRALALQSLAVSNEKLPVVITDPLNLKAREDLQTSSALAGLAISQTRTGIAHAISYPLTTHFGVPHGLACSFSLEIIIDDFLLNGLPDDTSRWVCVKTKKMLSAMELKRRLLFYANTNKIINTVKNEPLNERAQNYNGNSVRIIESVIKYIGK